MNILNHSRILSVTLALASLTLTLPAHAGKESHPLVGAVPNDVFLCIVGTQYPERDYVDEYWGEVIQAAIDTGIGEDLLGLVTGNLDADGKAEFERIRTLAEERLTAVDWQSLFKKDTLFAERWSAPEASPMGMPFAGPPEMVMICTLDDQAAAENHQHIAAILKTFADEVNKAADEEIFALAQAEAHGAKITSLTLANRPPGAPDLWLAVAHRNDLLLLGMGRQMFSESLALLAGESDKTPLLKDPRYTSAFAKLPPAENQAVFFDLQKMISIYRPMVQMLPQMMAEGDPNAPVDGVVAAGNRMLDALSFVDYTATSDYTDGYTCHSDSIAVLVDDAKQRAIYPTLAVDRTMSDYRKYLPKETLSFSASTSINLSALYDFLIDTVRTVGPQGEAALTTWTALQEQNNFDVKRDVTDWVTGDMISITLDDNRGSVWMIKVSDEDTAKQKTAAAIQFLTETIAELAAENPMLGMMTATRAPLNDERLEGFEGLRFMMSPEPIVWGLADDYLIIGTSADAVALCRATAAGKHPGIADNSRIMKEAILPTGGCTSVSYTDQRNLGQELAGMLGGVSMGSGMASAFIPDPDAKKAFMRITRIISKLTPVVRKIDFYKSTASCTTFDGNAWLTRSVTHYVPRAERDKNENSETLQTTAAN